MGGCQTPPLPSPHPPTHPGIQAPTHPPVTSVLPSRLAASASGILVMGTERIWGGEGRLQS